MRLFSSFVPDVTRRDLAREVEQRLQTFEDKVRAAAQQVSP
ncbi:MAG TPA: hypothetical protein VF469_09815 [Kofleriaceae bacterium]